MPTLPSGRTLALAKHHIPPAGVVTFKCPPGHYWFEQLDRKICPPPLEPGSEFLCDFVHAPCPKTRAEALAILWVLERIEPGGTVVPHSVTETARNSGAFSAPNTTQISNPHAQYLQNQQAAH